MNTQEASLELATGTQVFQGSQGRWAGERLMEVLAEGGQLSAAALRTNRVLSHEEWILFDNEILEGYVPRLRAVADLIAAGLTKPIPNSMGKTVLQYDRLGDLADATLSMDGLVRTENDRPDYQPAQIPIPMTHKDFGIPLRTLAASRNTGEALDTTMIRLAGRKCAELQEKMLLGAYTKQFGGLPIYGYMTHPHRHTSGFGTNGAWEQATKTGENILTDVQTMLSAFADDGQYGPFWIYTSPSAGINLDKDFKANGSDTIRQRLLRIENIAGIRSLDFLPTGNVLMVQAQRETVVLLQGEPLQTIQWDIQGGMGVEFKAFQIQVPLVRAISGKSGIFHMAVS